jgi:hypothetical protein
MKDDDMDSERMPLDGLKRSRDNERRARFFRFDPTVSTGTLLQSAGLAIALSAGYATYQSDKTQTKADIDAIHATAERDRGDVRALSETLRADLKDLKADVKDVNNVVVGLKAQADIGSKK